MFQSVPIVGVDDWIGVGVREVRKAFAVAAHEVGKGDFVAVRKLERFVGSEEAREGLIAKGGEALHARGWCSGVE